MSRVSGLGRRSPCHFGCKQALSSSYSGSPTHLRSQKLSLSSRDSWKLLDRGHFEHSRRRSWLQVAPAPPGLELGRPEPMTISFSEVDTFKLWLWFELYSPPSAEQRDLLEAVLNSWFTVGRLGGFNAQNMQVHYRGSEGASNLPYDSALCDSSMEAMFHDIGPLEAKGAMCRCWVNMGTADELALDILINALNTFSQENLGIKQLTVGGNNKSWPAPPSDHKTMDPLLAGMDPRDY